jgi:pimeloyl-ACP methyl ester carboxylesterase
MKKIAIFLALLALVFVACGNNITIKPQEGRTIAGQDVRVEEISFRSGKFKLVGDLLIPPEGERHPAVIMVHGSGDATRDGAVPFGPMIEIFLRNGYAVFSWDKPGSGASTGGFDGEHVLAERAAILANGIEVLTKHTAIDATRIGLWGISQAGWVMPLALDLTDDVAFMIVVSGGAEDSIEQMAYQVGQQVICAGGSVEQAALAEQYWPQFPKATSYVEYRQAVETLLEIPGVKANTGLELAEQDNWKPWPQDIDAFFDPMEIIEYTTIPVLAFFGQLDKNIDPVQGAQAYEAALQKAGNKDYQIEVIPGVAHVLMPAETGCIGESGSREYAPEYLNTLETWLQHLSP